MAYIKYITMGAIILSSNLVGCSSLNKKIPGNYLPDEIYAIAKQKLQVSNWKQAIIQLEILDNYYPFSPYSQQVQLDLIYAYYKNDNFSLAKTTIDRFTQLNPTHPNIDFVIYIRGLINMAWDENVLQKFFRIDRFDRDPQHARNAFNDLSKLVRNYPKSQYVDDAIKRLTFLKNRLAKYEYSIASYYTHCGAWVAVVNRVEGMLRDYPDIPVTQDGLKLMENAYRQMKMNNQADKVAKIIAANSGSI